MTTMNKSGFSPLDLRVLVKPDAVAEKTAGGVFLPGQSIEADRWATTRGTLVAKGANAWTESSQHERTPALGDRVLFAKYGKKAEIKGADGETYWLMNDEDILALEEAA